MFLSTKQSFPIGPFMSWVFAFAAFGVAAFGSGAAWILWHLLKAAL